MKLLFFAFPAHALSRPIFTLFTYFLILVSGPGPVSRCGAIMTPFAERRRDDYCLSRHRQFLHISIHLRCRQRLGTAQNVASGERFALHVAIHFV